jgi:hypothetical protein
VDEVPDHFLRGEVVEQTQHTLEQQTVVATAQLLGYDNARMERPSSLPLLVQRSEVANVERENSPAFGRCEGELFLVGGGVFAGFFGRQDVVTAAAQVRGQPSHDVAVEVKPDEQWPQGRLNRAWAPPWGVNLDSLRMASFITRSIAGTIGPLSSLRPGITRRSERHLSLMARCS